MGPTCDVQLETVSGAILDEIDAVLASAAEEVKRTRKGHTWDVRIKDRPIHVSLAESLALVTLSAGCNTGGDYSVLRELAEQIAEATGGKASEPVK